MSYPYEFRLECVVLSGLVGGDWPHSAGSNPSWRADRVPGRGVRVVSSGSVGLVLS